jgi:hypothetical protein
VLWWVIYVITVYVNFWSWHVHGSHSVYLQNRVWQEWTIGNRAFKIIWMLCLVNLRLCLPVTTFIHLIRGSISFRMTSASSPPSLIALILKTITCVRILHLVRSEAPPLWKLMPKGERNEYDNQGELACGHSDYVYYVYVLLCFILLSWWTKLFWTVFDFLRFY